MASKEELINSLEARGITDLAETVRDSDVAIYDEKNFTVYEEGDRGKEGYGVQYAIRDDEIDGKDASAVYSRLIEPEGGTVWEWADPDLYEMPEQEDEMDAVDTDEIKGPSIADMIEKDNQYDRDFFEGKEPDLTEEEIEALAPEEVSDEEIDRVWAENHEDTDADSVEVPEDNDRENDSEDVGID